jgi:hypothetical protein
VVSSRRKIRQCSDGLRVCCQRTYIFIFISIFLPFCSIAKKYWIEKKNYTQQRSNVIIWSFLSTKTNLNAYHLTFFLIWRSWHNFCFCEKNLVK